ncbi:MAG: hypothetical protein IKY33_01010 [Clostridia bacterium]|nr:hypothetical protein [Clostridia bacterium]
MAKRQKKQKWEREDRLLDYITTHKAEITRYLVVVLIGELWRWVLDNIIYNLFPFMLTYRSGFTFILWALPYFLACKLWVWRQTEDDSFTWGTQGLKFIMSILVIAVINIGVNILMSDILLLNSSLAALFGHLAEEILYFIAMYYVILQPHKKN